MSVTWRRSGARARSEVTHLASVVLRVVITAAALGWAALIALVPAWEARAAERGPSFQRRAAVVLRILGAQVCHQRPERSFHLHGRPLAVCGRCTGLYLSGALGLLAAAARWRRPGPAARPATPAWWPARLDARAGWLALAALPTAVTWGLEVAGVWDPGTSLRAVAALPFGMAAGWLMGRALQR